MTVGRSDPVERGTGPTDETIREEETMTRPPVRRDAGAARRPAARLVLFALAAACAAALAAPGVALATNLGASAAQASGASWLSAGHGPSDSRTQPDETTIGVGNVGRLAPKWIFTTHGDVSATPTVAGGVVYFPDWGGYLNAVNASNGSLVWQAPISSYVGVTGGLSRDSPAIAGNELILGDTFFFEQSGGAHVFAVNRSTGKLIWNTQVNSNPAAIITGNPVVYGNEVIVGVSSNEETDTLDPFYPCCSFRGSVVALSAATGQMLWKTYDMPPSSTCTASNPPSGCGYSGGAVWGTPAIDPATNSVYIGTGNNYTETDAANACQAAAAKTGTSNADCTAPDDYFDSELSLNLLTGHLNWGHKVEGYDAFVLACLFGSGVSWCPSPAGPDYDFGGSGPNLLHVNGGTLVGAGQKSGIYWAFNPTSGDVAWDRVVGAGGAEGGIEWGTAYDGSRIYVPISDEFGAPYKLESGQPDQAGSWAALDPATGRFIWDVPDPNGSADLGPPAEANGVVYVSDTVWFGDNLFALDAATGKILWRFAATGSEYGGAAIVNGTVYWGSGYWAGLPSDKLYAFTVGGR